MDFIEYHAISNTKRRNDYYFKIIFMILAWKYLIEKNTHLKVSYYLFNGEITNRQIYKDTKTRKCTSRKNYSMEASLYLNDEWW